MNYSKLFLDSEATKIVADFFAMKTGLNHKSNEDLILLIECGALQRDVLKEALKMHKIKDLQKISIDKMIETAKQNKIITISEKENVHTKVRHDVFLLGAISDELTNIASYKTDIRREIAENYANDFFKEKFLEVETPARRVHGVPYIGDKKIPESQHRGLNFISNYYVSLFNLKVKQRKNEDGVLVQSSKTVKY